MLDIDISLEAGDWGDESALLAIARAAAEATLEQFDFAGGQTSELSLLFTDDAHIQVLNAQWRSKDKPTNVLSFPAFDVGSEDELPPMLGDIVLARETILREAALENKPLEHHLTHLIVHGLLHLLGFDHETEDEAEEMEALERVVLAKLAIPDPYD